jgi:regulator of RNase E activity RraA
MSRWWIVNLDLPIFYPDLGVLTGDVLVVDDNVVVHIPPNRNDRFFNREDLLVDDDEDFFSILAQVISPSVFQTITDFNLFGK